MKIAVLGWYGHDNAGDERMKYCLAHYLTNLGGIKSIDFYDLHAHAIKGKTSQFDEYDLVIIGGGGLIFSQCNLHDFINGINTKMVTLGISIERPKLTGNAKKFSSSLLEKSMAVLVRDHETAQKLREYDTNNIVKVSSDLTFLEPFETVSPSNNKKIGINLLPKPLYMQYSTICNPIVSFFLRQLNRFGLERYVKVADFSTLIKELQNEYELIPIPLYCAFQEEKLSTYRKNDVEFLRHYFKVVPSEFFDNIIDPCRLFLAMRLHGSIFALQKGIPVLSMSYLPKNRAFMREAGLESCVIDSFDYDHILNSISYIDKNHASIRSAMLDYKEKATRKIRDDLNQILNCVS